MLFALKIVVLCISRSYAVVFPFTSTCWYAEIVGFTEIPMYIREPVFPANPPPGTRRRRLLQSSQSSTATDLVPDDATAQAAIEFQSEVDIADFAIQAINFTTFLSATNDDIEDTFVTLAADAKKETTNVINGYDHMMTGIGLGSSASRWVTAGVLVAAGAWPAALVLGIFEAFCIWLCNDDDPNIAALDAQQAVLDLVRGHITAVKTMLNAERQLRNNAEQLNSNIELVQRFAHRVLDAADRLNSYIIQSQQNMNNRLAVAYTFLGAAEAEFSAQRARTYTRIQRLRYDIRIETHNRRHALAVARQKLLLDLEQIGPALRVKQLRALEVIGDGALPGTCNVDIKLMPIQEHVRNVTQAAIQGLYDIRYVPSRPTGQNTPDTTARWVVYGLLCQMNMNFWLTDSIYTGINNVWEYVMLWENTRCYEFEIKHVNDTTPTRTLGPSMYATRDDALLDAESNFKRFVDYHREIGAAGQSNWLENMIWAGLPFGWQAPVRVANLTKLPPGPAVIWPARLEVVNPLSTGDEYIHMVTAAGKTSAQLLSEIVYMDYYDPVLTVATMTLRLGFERPSLNAFTEKYLTGTFDIITSCYGPTVPVMVLKRPDGKTLYEYTDVDAWDPARPLSIVHASPIIRSHLRGRTRFGWMAQVRENRQLLCQTAQGQLTVCPPASAPGRGMTVRYCSGPSDSVPPLAEFHKLVVQTDFSDLSWATLNGFRMTRAVSTLRISNASVAKVPLEQAISEALDGIQVFDSGLDTTSFVAGYEDATLALDGSLNLTAKLLLEATNANNQTKRDAVKVRALVNKNIAGILAALDALPKVCGFMNWPCIVDELDKKVDVRSITRVVMNSMVLLTVLFLFFTCVCFLRTILICFRVCGQSVKRCCSCCKKSSKNGKSHHGQGRSLRGSTRGSRVNRVYSEGTPLLRASRDV
jgi:hypothetical protein